MAGNLACCRLLQSSALIRAGQGIEFQPNKDVKSLNRSTVESLLYCLGTVREDMHCLRTGRETLDNRGFR